MCSGYSSGGAGDGKANLPAGCDWFGGGGMQRLEAQLAGIFAGIVAVIGLLVWFRRFRESQSAGAAMLLGFAGLATLVWGATSDYSMIRNVVGFVLVGFWFVITGLWLLGQRWLYAMLTILMGVVRVRHGVRPLDRDDPVAQAGPDVDPRDPRTDLGCLVDVRHLLAQGDDEEPPVVDERPEPDPEPRS